MIIIKNSTGDFMVGTGDIKGKGKELKGKIKGKMAEEKGKSKGKTAELKGKLKK
jgi:hypothetical protein